MQWRESTHCLVAGGTTLFRRICIRDFVKLLMSARNLREERLWFKNIISHLFWLEPWHLQHHRFGHRGSASRPLNEHYGHYPTDTGVDRGRSSPQIDGQDSSSLTESQRRSCQGRRSIGDSFDIPVWERVRDFNDCWSVCSMNAMNWTGRMIDAINEPKYAELTRARHISRQCQPQSNTDSLKVPSRAW
jgi:hypothetical protein